MMSKSSLTRIAAAATLTAGFALAATVPAQASHGGGGGVQRSGQCSAGSQWKLKAKSDDGAIEVEAEVDTNVSGQTFNWRLADNGKVQAKGQSTTQGASSSFSVERRIAHQSGAAKIGFKATNPANGETCKGRLTF